MDISGMSNQDALLAIINERRMAEGSAPLAELTKGPRGKAGRRKSTASTGNKASAKQVAYALTLIRQGGWHDSFAGQDGSPEPTRDELQRMSSSAISELIGDLR